RATRLRPGGASPPRQTFSSTRTAATRASSGVAASSDPGPAQAGEARTQTSTNNTTSAARAARLQVLIELRLCLRGSDGTRGVARELNAGAGLRRVRRVREPESMLIAPPWPFTMYPSSKLT